MPADDEIKWSAPPDITDWKPQPDAGCVNLDDEALIPIEKPTGFHRYVLREFPPTAVIGHRNTCRIHQQQWSVITFEEGSNGTEHLEWRDVPIVTEEWTELPQEIFRTNHQQALHDALVNQRRRQGLPDYEKPPLGQPPAFLQEQEAKSTLNTDEMQDDARRKEKLARVDASIAKQLQQSMERNASMARALEWIINNTSAHPANMVKVAEEGLGRNR